MLTKKCLRAFVLILIFQIVLLLAFVFLRLIDFDEGSYLSSAYLVKCGKLPYLDFFFPQMPYLPMFMHWSLLMVYLRFITGGSSR